MKNSDKIRVAVLFGGRSAEHEISLLSATNVIENLDPNLFQVIPIGIDKKGNWFLGKDIFVQSLKQHKVPQLSENNSQERWFTPEWIGKPAEKNPEQFKELLKSNQSSALFDVVFPVMHGSFCEDGSLQGLLELADLPYVGCGVLSSAIGMDKDIAKRLVREAGVKVGPYVVIHKDQWLAHPETISKDIEYRLSSTAASSASNLFPLFVKPANAGSSVGVSKVKQMNELADKINEAFRFDNKVLVEKAINAIDLEVAVLESLQTDEGPIISVVGQIKSKHEFYSYAAKYLDESSTVIIPAEIDDALKKHITNMAKIIFQTLECEGMARIDLFLDQDSHEIYFNEINTIPGFTTISMYPKLMAASGIPYPDLLKHLIQLAIKRHKQKSKLVRNYEEEHV